MTASNPGGKTLLIHAGTYKTGSSAIQLYLARAAHAGDLGGARYPRTGRDLGIQHGNLLTDLRGGRAFIPAHGGWDELLAEINASDAPLTIVSSEHFASLEPEYLAVIGEKCARAGVAVRWVQYLREQAGFYNAFYVERMVTMRPEFHELVDLPFEEFGTWSPIDLSILNYASFVDQVRAGIPGVEVVLRPFSRAELLDGDVVADFCATAGIPHAAGYTQETNIGTGWRTVETARRLIKILEHAQIRHHLDGIQNRAALRMRWVTLIRSELVKATTELGWNTESAIYLTPQFREELLARYAEENRRIAEFAGFDWPAIVAAEKPKAANVGDFDEIPASELMQVMQRVVPLFFRPPEKIQELMVPEPRPGLLRRAAGHARRRAGLAAEPEPF